MGFILTAPIYYYTKSEQKRKPSNKRRWGIVDFIDAYGETCHLLEYLNRQISDGWAENGIMLMSYDDHKLLELCVENTSFYESVSIADCIGFE